jgi:hypothetical protein
VSKLQFNAAQAFAERKKTAKLLTQSINRLISFALQLKKGNLLAAHRVLFSRTGHEFTTLLGRKPPSGSSQNAAVLKASEILMSKAGPATKALQKKRLDKYGAPRFKSDKEDLTKDDFGSLWLEYSYGWRPLVKDIYGAAELLARTYDPYFTSKPPLQVVTGSSSKNGLLAKAVNRFLGYTTYSFSATGPVDQRTKCVVRYQVDDPAADALRRTGISNPALLAWELLPYSFVVDWVFPLGSYLEQVNATSGLKFHSGYMTTVRTWQLTSSVTESNPDGQSKGIHHRKGARIKRRRLDSFPSPVFPSVSLGLNTSQVISGLALLNQIFSR